MIRYLETRDHIDECSFASPIRADQPKNFSWPEREVDGVERENALETNAHALGLELTVGRTVELDSACRSHISRLTANVASEL